MLGLKGQSSLSCHVSEIHPQIFIYPYEKNACSTESYPLPTASCFLPVSILQALLQAWLPFFFSHR